MTMAVRRPPGVRFDIAASDPGEILPRMDIAMFAGFAQAGPVGTPVAVESLAAFERVFGASFDLAFDEAAGGPLRSLLHGTVARFFADGGRRCWIVRVLDEATAAHGEFQVPSAVGAVFDGNWKIAPRILETRDPGSWSDAMGLSLRSESVPLDIQQAAADPESGPVLTISVKTARDVAAGDLLVAELEPGLLATMLATDVAMGEDESTMSAIAKTRMGPSVRLVREEDLRGRGEARIRYPSPVHGAAEVDRPADIDWIASGRVGIRFEVDADHAPSPGTVGRIVWDGREAWMLVRERLASSSGTRRGRSALRLQADLREIGLEDVAARLGEAIGKRIRKVDRIRHELATSGPFREASSGTFAADAFPSNLPSSFPLRSGDPGALLLPLCDDPESIAPSGPRRSTAPALERDGLGRFSSDLFLDARLCGEPTERQLPSAEQFILLTPDPVPLRGIHALLAQVGGGAPEEATLVAAPDASHPRWTRKTSSDSWWTVHPHPSDHPERTGTFHPCVLEDLKHPRFIKGVPPGPDGTFMLRWTDPVPGASFELQESAESKDGAWNTIFEGESNRFVRRDAVGGTRWYRVRSIQGGKAGAWSYPVEVRAPATGFVCIRRQYPSTLADTSDLVRVQRALLRVAAARGDTLAILSLPRSFRWDEAKAHTDRLLPKMDPVPASDGIADVPALRADESRTLSHGILAHPWIVPARDTTNPVPPDGSIAGLFARVASEGSPWIAPGGVPLEGIVATDLATDVADLPGLVDTRICPVVRSARGFSPAWFDTLSDDPELRPANVRRFMGLLRRLAYRYGVESVFEPAGRALERSLERTFRDLLRSLWMRGAMRGSGEGSSYRVDVKTDSDKGAAMVELRVAPSLPLSFLLVTLRAKGGGLLVEERA